MKGNVSTARKQVPNVRTVDRVASTRFPASPVLLALVTLTAIAVATACGGGNATPTAPSQPTTGAVEVPLAVAPTSLTASGYEPVPGTSAFPRRVSFAGQMITLSWSEVPNAASYLVEISSNTALTGDVAKFNVTTNRAEWTPTSLSTFFITVRGRNQSGAGPQSEWVQLDTISGKSHLEALLLGSGPYANRTNRGCPGGSWMGWQPGTRLRVKVASDLSAAEQAQVSGSLEHLAEVTAGQLNASIVMSDIGYPIPGDNEVVIVHVGAGRDARCPADTGGCAQVVRTSGSWFSQVRIVVIPNGRIAHEIGHGVYGLCHVDTDSTSGLITSMDQGYLVDPVHMHPADLDVIRAAYQAGLAPGASRSAFAAAGLVDP
jgi:hypothetical protein